MALGDFTIDSLIGAACRSEGVVRLEGPLEAVYELAIRTAQVNGGLAFGVNEAQRITVTSHVDFTAEDDEGVSHRIHWEIEITLHRDVSPFVAYHLLWTVASVARTGFFVKTGSYTGEPSVDDLVAKLSSPEAIEAGKKATATMFSARVAGPSTIQ